MKRENYGIDTVKKDEKLTQLLTETKETIATDLRAEDFNRSFGTVDMWNRQKRQRTSIQMRRWLN